MAVPKKINMLVISTPNNFILWNNDIKVEID